MVVSCDLQGVRIFLVYLYIFLLRIVHEEKGIGTNSFRCHLKTIWCSPVIWERRNPWKTPATKRYMGCPSRAGRTSRRILL